jgi:hypothetical protein
VVNWSASGTHDARSRIVRCHVMVRLNIARHCGPRFPLCPEQMLTVRSQSAALIRPVLSPPKNWLHGETKNALPAPASASPACSKRMLSSISICRLGHVYAAARRPARAMARKVERTIVKRAETVDRRGLAIAFCTCRRCAWHRLRGCVIRIPGHGYGSPGASYGPYGMSRSTGQSPIFAIGSCPQRQAFTVGDSGCRWGAELGHGQFRLQRIVFGVRRVRRV